MSRGARIRSPYPRNTLKMPRIRYQIFVTHIGPPIAPPVPLPRLSLYPVRHRDLLLYDPHMCFVCTRRVTYGPCVIYHTALAADREWDVRCIQQALRLPRCLIMLILPRRHKLNRAGSTHSNCFISSYERRRFLFPLSPRRRARGSASLPNRRTFRQSEFCPGLRYFSRREKEALTERIEGRVRRPTTHIPFRRAEGRVNFLRLHFTCTCPNSFVSGTEFIHRQRRCTSHGIPRRLN